jgi:tetratricopeptide (TPR) repeat protein
MKTKTFYTLLLLFISLSLHAQRQGQLAIDSMLKDLNSDRYRKDDTNRVKQLVRISWKYSDFSNPDESMKYAQQALDLATKLNWKKGTSRAYEVVGEIYMGKADNAQALEYYNKAIKVGEEIGEKEIVGDAIGNSARVYYQMGDYKKSIENNFRSIKISEELGNKLNIAHGLNGIGACYVDQGDYPKAMDYLFKALGIFEQLGLKRSVAASRVNIANVFLHEGDTTQALGNYRQALKLYEELENNVGVAYCYTSIGNVYQVRKELEKSLEYYEKALKISYETEDKDLTGKLLANIGNTYYFSHKYINAVAYLQSSLKIFTDVGDREGIAKTFAVLGDCFLAIIREGSTNAISKKAITIAPEISKYWTAVSIPAGKAALLSAAFDNYQKGLALGREINAQGVMQSCYEGLSAAYKLSNNYKKALEYADTARTVKDSIFSKDNNEKIVRLEMKNQFGSQHLADSLKHAQDIQVGILKLQKQKWALYISLAVFIFVIVLTVLFQRTKTARARVAQQAMFSRQLLEIELKALRAQMNPHFIFNCLNSIQAFILRENKEEATAYLQKFSKLIRMILDNSQKTSHTIEDEAEILGLYMDMERLRLKNKFDFEIKMSGDLDPTFTEIPSMVLQPLVENSIWHGLTNSPYKGLLTVEFIKKEDRLICIVKDNGVGRDKSKELKSVNATKHESKGLKLIEDRLQAWSQVNDLQYIFKTFNNNNGQETGTSTEITILYPYYA